MLKNNNWYLELPELYLATKLEQQKQTREQS